MSLHDASVPLPAAAGGPSNVMRVGNTVRRRARPWSRTVHTLLRHLEAVGFTGCPRVVDDGFDADGNEVLTYIEGAIQHPRPWTDDGIWHVGQMLRRLHDATATFTPPEDSLWQPWLFHLGAPSAVIGHCDTGPWHMVVRDARPVAFIDWLLAGPTDRLDEVAATAWWNAQLHDDVAARDGLPDAATRAAQMRYFLDGYELARADRAGMVTRMIEFAIRDCAWEAVRAGVTPASTDPTPLWALAWRARAAAWMLRHRSTLERAITQ